MLLDSELCSWVALAFSLGLVRASTGVCLVSTRRFIGVVVGCVGGLSWGLSFSYHFQLYSAFVGMSLVVLGLSCPDTESLLRSSSLLSNHFKWVKIQNVLTCLF